MMLYAHAGLLARHRVKVYPSSTHMCGVNALAETPLSAWSRPRVTWLSPSLHALPRQEKAASEDLHWREFCTTSRRAAALSSSVAHERDETVVAA